MMTREDHRLFQAVCECRDELSEQLSEMRDSRDFWRGGCLVMAGLALLEIVRQWAG